MSLALQLLAEADNAFVGQLAYAVSFLLALAVAAITVASHFATRREVESLMERVDKLERRTEVLDRRINRLLAGQMLIAGQMGVALSAASLRDAMQQVAREEESEEATH
jgi:hypothetical protein